MAVTFKPRPELGKAVRLLHDSSRKIRKARAMTFTLLLSRLGIAATLLLSLVSGKPTAFGLELGSAAIKPINQSSSAQKTETILFIGDSIAEGYGVKREESFPELAGQILRDKLRAKGRAIKIVNGSISGSLSSDVESRLNWYMKRPPTILVLELGGNDALKGTPAETIKKNLAKAIDVAQAHGVQVVLAGMQIFANYGAAYARDFAKIYPELAHEKKCVLIPFILDGVALHKNLNQPDGKHPNAAGHAIIATNLSRTLEPLL